MLQSLQSQADADDDPAAEEARAEKEEAPGSWMILDVHWCIGAETQDTNALGLSRDARCSTKPWAKQSRHDKFCGAMMGNVAT